MAPSPRRPRSSRCESAPMAGARSPTRSPGRASSCSCTTSCAWGSRGLPADTLPETERRLAPALAPLLGRPGTTAASALYNAGAALQEHILAKYCTILGTSLAALICHEDRVAAAYLRSRGDVVERADRLHRPLRRRLPGGAACWRATTAWRPPRSSA